MAQSYAGGLWSADCLTMLTQMMMQINADGADDPNSDQKIRMSLVS